MLLPRRSQCTFGDCDAPNEHMAGGASSSQTYVALKCLEHLARAEHPAHKLDAPEPAAEVFRDRKQVVEDEDAQPA